MICRNQHDDERPASPLRSEVAESDPLDAEPATEELSSTNNECVSEGQWIISMLSADEIPEIPVDEGKLRCDPI